MTDADRLDLIEKMLKRSGVVRFWFNSDHGDLGFSPEQSPYNPHGYSKAGNLREALDLIAHQVTDPERAPYPVSTDVRTPWCDEDTRAFREELKREERAVLMVNAPCAEPSGDAWDS